MNLETYEDARAAGCQPWDEADENGEVLMLIPVDLYEQLQDGQTFEDIYGDEVVFESGETSKDSRLGVLAYGVRVKKDG